MIGGISCCRNGELCGIDLISLTVLAPIAAMMDDSL